MPILGKTVCQIGTASDPGPQTIPKLARKWFRTASELHIGPQMILTKD